MIVRIAPGHPGALKLGQYVVTTEESAEGRIYAKTKRNRIKQRPQRGFYDKKTVFEILDSALMCHIAYMIDDQPYCTPTTYWREGDHLYWHGSAIGRALTSQTGGGYPVCLTVTHLDALTLARSGFYHGVNFRSVMAFGEARLVDGAEKRVLLDRFVNRFYPGRTQLLRETTEKEFNAVAVVGMRIEEASAKIRDVTFGDSDEDCAIPAWTALIEVKTVLGDIMECPRNFAPKPEAMAGFVPGRRLDDVMTESYHQSFPQSETKTS